MQIVDEQYRIPDSAQVDMLRKLALYWDGQWFLRTVEEFGLDAGIRANAQVRASFGRIEMRTILKTLKKKKANDLADAMQLLKTYLGVFMGKRLRTKFSLLSDTCHPFPSPSSLSLLHLSLPILPFKEIFN